VRTPRHFSGPVPVCIIYKQVAFEIVNRDILEMNTQAIVNPIEVDEFQRMKGLSETRLGARLLGRCGRGLRDEVEK
jgi:hypothetical protein